jgi:TPR repeat protein
MPAMKESCVQIRSSLLVFFFLAALTASQTYAEATEALPAGTVQDEATSDPDDLDRTCTAGDAESCSRIGYYHLLGAHGRTEDAAMAVPFLQRACDIGPPKGCSGLADAYRRGKGVPVDAPRASALHSKACDGGDYTGCYGMLSMQSEGLIAAADQESNLRLVEQICRPDQNSWFCVDAKKLITRIQVPPAVYQAQQCEAGEAYECLIIANSHADGDGVPVDMARAAAAYGKACNLGLAVACNRLGEYYAYGTGVSQDFVRAAQLFQQGCNEKSVDGCANLGAMYFNGTGVPQDLNHAAVLNQKACAGGNVRGCDFMERAGIAILGTLEQRQAEADALDRESKRQSAESLQRAFEVNMGDLANHIEREAQTRADADAMLAGIEAPSEGPVTTPSPRSEQVAGAADPSPGSESAAVAGQPLRFILTISMRNLAGDTVNPTCYSNVITRPGPPGWGAPGFLPPGSGEQARETVQSFKSQFIAKCRASGRDITSEGNFSWLSNRTQDEAQRLASTRARYREDVSVVLD